MEDRVGVCAAALPGSSGPRADGGFPDRRAGAAGRGAQGRNRRDEGGGGETPGDDRISELERRLEVLAPEIEKLKIGEAADPSADESEHGLGPAASKIYRTERGLSIGGYGELLYQNFDSERDDGAASGRTDTLDLLRARPLLRLQVQRPLAVQHRDRVRARCGRARSRSSSPTSTTSGAPRRTSAAACC